MEDPLQMDKLVGAESCFPRCLVLCKAAAQLPHSDILGQPVGSGLYKQDWTLPEALRSCSGNVGVMHREGVGGTPAREECYNRFQVETPQQFQRLATQYQGVQGTIDLHYGPMTVDLFASFRNTQLTIFFSWKPDPIASAVDALAQTWIHHRPYMFSPFAL